MGSLAHPASYNSISASHPSANCSVTKGSFKILIPIAQSHSIHKSGVHSFSSIRSHFKI
jgi:hypothetical protein